MRARSKAAIVIALVISVAAVVAFKPRVETQAVYQPAATSGLPRLVDLGATTCIPCRMMAPILDELRDEFDGRFEVHFIDVWQHPDAGQSYGMRVIPTQIFFDAEGRELFRHEGFYSREQILDAWRDLGYRFSADAHTAGDPRP